MFIVSREKSYLVIAVISALFLAGCASDYSGDTYESSSIGEVSRSDYGTIISKRKIKITSEGKSLGTGALIGGTAGAGVGAIAGSMIGGGDNKLLGAAIGGLAGGASGHMIQNRSQEGAGYTVRLDNGSTVTVSQGVQPVLSVGQRVMVINSNEGRSRVVPSEQ
ncbi:MAG: glycine zipper 2TM domain-containing protein [Holosporales bacterium]|nr:glycine zipper 2TM domain-containing protein [Holosporales bacterium]